MLKGITYFFFVIPFSICLNSFPHRRLIIVYSETSSKENSTEFVLLHAYRSTDELPPESVMNNFSKWSIANPDRLKISTFVEDGNSSSTPNYKAGKVTEIDIREALATDDSSRTLVLVCGPDRYAKISCRGWNNNLTRC